MSLDQRYIYIREIDFFSIMNLYSKCFAHFGDFRNHSFYNIITRLFASLIIRVIYSGSTDIDLKKFKKLII